MNVNVYITKQGDSWDLLAYLFYGSEYLMTDLVEANQKYRHYIEFPEGIELIIPDVAIDDESELPDWLIDDDAIIDEDGEEDDEDEAEGLDSDEDDEIN